MFYITRVETINYYLDYSRDELIGVLAFSRSDGDEKNEAPIAQELSKLSDEELLAEFQGELDEFDFLYDYIIERSEKYGDVQSNDITVSLEVSKNE